MIGNRFLKRLRVMVVMVFFLVTQVFSAAVAHDSSTLYNGCRGEEIRELQQALIDLGFLKGTADGIFGNNTENAVRKFQKKYKLTVDGLAGSVTRELLLSKAEAKRNPSVPTPSPAPAASPSPSSSSGQVSGPDSRTASSSGSLFSGNYSVIRYGSRGDRVRALQNGLISAGCLSGCADGVFGSKTFTAVKSFQRANRLTVDGIAGRQTLAALETAFSGRQASSAAVLPEPGAAPESAAVTVSPATPVPDSEDINERISGPSAGAVQLLHWFNDIKPSLSNGQHLLVYDPSSGLSWTLRILSRGRHCDAEPLTSRDTRTMVKAFGGVNTWNQKPVYVLLPGGTWTIGSTHDMPHDSGSIKSNDFNGHLCVHFLRDMEEAQKNDPKYGVSNQETIRSFWKKLTGLEITD